MRRVFGGSVAGARRIDGEHLQSRSDDVQSDGNSSAKSFRPVTRINGDRISFADLATFVWPTKTDANLAFVARVDARTARSWLSGATEPKGPVLAIILAEIMKRYQQQ